MSTKPVRKVEAGPPTGQPPELWALGQDVNWLVDHGAGATNVFEYIPPQYHAGIQIGTSSVDVAGWINEAAEGAGKLVLPKGRYNVGSPLARAQDKAFVIEGAGQFATRLVPTNAMAGQSVIKWTNVRNSVIRDLGIEGNAGAHVGAGIEFNIGAENPETSTGNLVKNVWLNCHANGMVDGVKMTCDAGFDVNNDNHVLEDLLIENVTRAAYRIEHSNSLIHKIVRGTIFGGDIGVQCLAGSFEIDGTFLVLVQSREFEIGAGGATLYHPCYIRAKSEVPDPGTSPNPTILYVDAASSYAQVFMRGYERVGSSPNQTMIDFRSAGGHLTISDCALSLGQVGQKISATGAGSIVTLSNSYLPVAEIESAGTVVSRDNRWAGAADPTLSGAGTFVGFQPEAWRAVGEAGNPAFQNSWVNFGGASSPLRFKKDAAGRVELRGVVKDGVSASTVFSLPGGYRPANTLNIAIPANNTFAVLTIDGAGNVVSNSSDVTWVSLDGVSFYADGS